MECIICHQRAMKDLETDSGIFQLCLKEDCEKQLKEYLKDKEDEYMESRIQRW